MTAPSIPPVLDPRAAKPIGNLEQRYRAHLRRCAPELVAHAADASYDRTLRACMLMLRELRESRLDAADAVLAEAEALTDWEAVGEARHGR